MQIQIGFRSQLICIFTVCKSRIYPGSAGLGLSIDGWILIKFLRHLIKGSIFLKNRHFIIQERFNKLIYGIYTIIKHFLDKINVYFEEYGAFNSKTQLEIKQREMIYAFGQDLLLLKTKKNDDMDFGVHAITCVSIDGFIAS